MRKALALALAVTITVTGVPVGVVAAAVISLGFSPLHAAHILADAYSPGAPEFYAEEFPQDAQGIRNARRLGGRTAFNRPALVKIDTLRQMLKAPNAQADIRKVLSDAGIVEISGPRGSVGDTVIDAMSSWPEASATETVSCDTLRPQEGFIAECAFQPGSMMKWMALRPNAPKDRTAGIVNNVRWAGPKPFSAFIFTATAGGKVYTFVVPKECGNLALLDVADVPPAPVVVVAPPAPPAPVAPPPAPVLQQAAPQQPTPPTEQSLNCIAQGPKGEALPGVLVRVRDAQGNIIKTATTDQSGNCFFGFLNPGNYTVEVVSVAGTVIGVSAATLVGAGATATAIVATSAVSALAIAAGAGGIVGFLASTAGIATIIGAGTLGVVAVTTRGDASGSR